LNLPSAVLEDALGVVRQRRVEQRADVLVQLAVDVGQPFLQLVALGARGGGREILGRRLVGDHLHDDGTFGHELAIVEHQRRHLALGIDLQIVVAVLELLGPQVDLDEFVLKTGFMQRDMGGQRAGAGAVIELHGYSSLGNVLVLAMG
jgi:hypothetical protein